MWLQWADRCPPWLPAHTTQWDQVSHLFINPFIRSAVTWKQNEVVPPRRDPKGPCGLLYPHSPSIQKSLLWVLGSCCVSVSLSVLWLWGPTNQSSICSSHTKLPALNVFLNSFLFHTEAPAAWLGKATQNSGTPKPSPVQDFSPKIMTVILPVFNAARVQNEHALPKSTTVRKKICSNQQIQF